MAQTKEQAQARKKAKSILEIFRALCINKKESYGEICVKCGKCIKYWKFKTNTEEIRKEKG